MTRHINLLDPPKKARSPYATALQMGIPVALALLIMGGWSTAVSVRAASVKKELARVDDQLRPVSEQLSQLQEGLGVEQVNSVLRDRLALAQAQLRARQDIQTALQRGDLGSSQGFSEFMRAFARQTVPGLWLTGLELENGGRDITLTGRALSADAVAMLVGKLRAEPALKGRTISTLHVAPVPPPEKSAEESAPLAATPPAVTVYEFQISSVVPPETPADASASASVVRNAAEQLAQKALK